MSEKGEGKVLAVLAMIGMISTEFVAFVGNFLVTFVILTSKQMRTVPNFLLVSLALSDFLVAALIMPPNILLYWNKTNSLGEQVILCKMFLFLDIFCCTASIFNLVVIALDRYFAIRSPLQYVHYRTSRRLVIVLALTYLFSGLVSTPPLVNYSPKDQLCEHNYTKIFVIYTASGSFFIPALIMLSVYAKIFLALRSRLSKRIQRSALSKVETMTQSCNQRTNTTIVFKANICGRQREAALKFPRRNKHKYEIKRVETFEEHTSYYTTPPKIEINPQTGVDISPLCLGKLTDGCPCSNVRETDLDESVGIRSSPMNGAGNKISEFCCRAKPSSELLNSPNQSVMSHKQLVLPEIIPDDSTNNRGVIPRTKQQITLSAERQAARTLGIIMGVFMICWLPFFTFYICKPFFWFNFDQPLKTLELALTWLGYLNSALNPVIYTIFNSDFRVAFQHFLHLERFSNSKLAKRARKHSFACCINSEVTREDFITPQTSDSAR